jgi:phosphatidylglycerophosphate synthase
VSGFIGDYRRMAKPRAVEEPGDIYLIRPLGYLFVQVFRRTPLTPTMVSFLAVFTAWYTAWLYYRSNSAGGDAALALLAAFMFLVHSALDSADGQLARVTGRTSELGRIVDGFCDSLSFLAIYVAIILSCWKRTGDYQVVVLLLGAAGVWSHSVQSSLTDYQRTLYLYAVHGKRDIIDSNPMRTMEAAERTGTLFARILHRLHVGYYRRQRRLLVTTAQLEEAVADWLERNPGRAEEMARLYERTQRPSLGGWALLASNSHKAGIILAAFLPVAAGSFWGSLGMGWYLIYDLLLTFVMIWLVRRQAGINRRTLQEIRHLGTGE